MIPARKRLCWSRCICAAIAALSAFIGAANGAELDEWPSVGRDPGGTRHSPLTQINRENVSRLKIAWTYRTGELERVTSPSLKSKVTFEATPLMIDGVMYLSTPTARVIALEATTPDSAPSSATTSWRSRCRELLGTWFRNTS